LPPSAFLKYFQPLEEIFSKKCYIFANISLNEVTTWLGKKKVIKKC